MPNIELKRPDPNVAAAAGKVHVNVPDGASVKTSVLKGISQALDAQGREREKLGEAIWNLGASVARAGGTVGSLKGAIANKEIDRATEIDLQDYNLDLREAAQEYYTEWQKKKFKDAEEALHDLQFGVEEAMRKVDELTFSAGTPGFRFAKERNITPNSSVCHDIKSAVARAAGINAQNYWEAKQTALSEEKIQRSINNKINNQVLDPKEYRKDLRKSSRFISDKEINFWADECVNQAKANKGIKDIERIGDPNNIAQVADNFLGGAINDEYANLDSVKAVKEKEKELNAARIDEAVLSDMLNEETTSAAGGVPEGMVANVPDTPRIRQLRKSLEAKREEIASAEKEYNKALAAARPTTEMGERAKEKALKNIENYQMQVFNSKDWQKFKHDPNHPGNLVWAQQQEDKYIPEFQKQREAWSLKDTSNKLAALISNPEKLIASNSELSLLMNACEKAFTEEEMGELVKMLTDPGAAAEVGKCYEFNFGGKRVNEAQAYKILWTNINCLNYKDPDALSKLKSALSIARYLDNDSHQQIVELAKDGIKMFVDSQRGNNSAQRAMATEQQKEKWIKDELWDRYGINATNGLTDKNLPDDKRDLVYECLRELKDVPLERTREHIRNLFDIADQGNFKAETIGAVVEDFIGEELVETKMPVVVREPNFASLHGGRGGTSSGYTTVTDGQKVRFWHPESRSYFREMVDFLFNSKEERK